MFALLFENHLLQSDTIRHTFALSVDLDNDGAIYTWLVVPPPSLIALVDSHYQAYQLDNWFKLQVINCFCEQKKNE